MRNTRLPLMRLAIDIHAHLHGATASMGDAELPEATWLEAQGLHRRMRRARHRGWHLAAGRLRCDLRDMLERLGSELRAVDRQFATPACDMHTASAGAGDLHADLVALCGEFDEVSFDRRRCTITVTTEPIELEGIPLGRFEICLDWRDLVSGHPYNYRVIALDPNPAASDASVTHPHVQDEGLCEGDGRTAIRLAQQQGRLLDFFVIVANLLRTYNSSSPYVSLSDWRGVECVDCGGTVADDERWTCEKCEVSLCGDCYRHCPGCDGSYCGECVARCEGCDETCCSGCLQRCARCGCEMCHDCLHDDERCNDCHEEEPIDEETEDVSTQPDSDTPLQPHRLGEAAVSA